MYSIIPPDTKLFTGQDQFFVPETGAIKRKRPDILIWRDRSEQHQTPFSGGIFRVQLKRRLQAVNAFFGRIYYSAHPDPILWIALVRFEQPGQQVTCFYFLSLTQRFDRFLKHSSICHG